jgi:hypothetical protein
MGKRKIRHDPSSQSKLNESVTKNSVTFYVATIHWVCFGSRSYWILVHTTRDYSLYFRSSQTSARSHRDFTLPPADVPLAPVSRTEPSCASDTATLD